LSSEGITIFISSHLLDEVQKICSHVAMISFGKLITSGKMENLLQESDLLMTEVQVDNVEKSAQLLSALEWVHRCDAVDGVLHVGIGLNKASDLVQYLVQKDIRVSAVIPKTSLEDLYLSKFGMKNKI